MKMFLVKVKNDRPFLWPITITDRVLKKYSRLIIHDRIIKCKAYIDFYCLKN